MVFFFLPVCGRSYPDDWLTIIWTTHRRSESSHIRYGRGRKFRCFGKWVKVALNFRCNFIDKSVQGIPLQIKQHQHLPTMIEIHCRVSVSSRTIRRQHHQSHALETELWHCNGGNLTIIASLAWLNWQGNTFVFLPQVHLQRESSPLRAEPSRSCALVWILTRQGI